MCRIEQKRATEQADSRGNRSYRLREHGAGAEREMGAYDDDFEEVGLLGRERRPHGYGGGGAARRGGANPRAGGEGKGFGGARWRVGCLAEVAVPWRGAV